MKLRGQHGYAIVVLLVAMAVMAILATAAMPAWKQASQREKEAELVFRGEQYVRAIKLFSQRAGPGVLPPTVDLLVKEKFLRKKFKDPITGLDFDLLGTTQTVAGPGGRGAPTGAQGGGRGAVQPRAPGTPNPGGAAGTVIQGRGGAGNAGIIGVASKSKDTSIRLYNGRTKYNEWPFIYVQQTQQPGNAAPGPGGAPGRGGPGRGAPGPGGRSTGPQPPGGRAQVPGIGNPGGPGRPPRR